MSVPERPDARVTVPKPRDRASVLLIDTPAGARVAAALLGVLRGLPDTTAPDDEAES